MFTGIVEETGRVQDIQTHPGGITLTVKSRVCSRGVQVGESLAVNGCCLTVKRAASRTRPGLLSFDLLKESWRLTNLQYLQKGSEVNLERSLQANGRLGGHFVTGHVDGMGHISRREQCGADLKLEIAAPGRLMRYLAYKGSVTVDGISLTVAAVRARHFTVWIIPHTLNLTVLKVRKVGDPVNLEVDMLAKYLERFLSLKK